MKNKFIQMLESLDITISDEKYNKFVVFYELLVEWNEKVNLTSITDFEDVFIKHFYDSLCLVKGVNLDHQSLLDVGSGAGFPSIPLKIIFEDLNITIIDSLNKRIKFLKVLTEALNIKVKLIHGRVEEHEYRNHYNIVTARAVSNLRVLTELCLPFVEVGGLFIALKGPKFIQEYNESKNAIKILGGKLFKTIEYDIDNQKRALILINKISSTKKQYPRIYGKIKSRPL
ncbi:MAG: 16S rRNA (guanine(527)-N(7))-methyltransferase RsmG [Candidatus Izimaplasma sp.]|nr:16S rRNA (guanine(527)-N(7))-methyltransferase RsmG [Candidatus Izimaplasma bacterium]